MTMTIGSWGRAVATALAVSGCAAPCADDGTVKMQHQSCEATAGSTSGGTTSGTPTGTGGDSTGTTGSTGAPTTGAESTSTSAVSTGAAESTGSKFDLGAKMDAGSVCGDETIDGSELCDDGNNNDLDACNKYCKPTPVSIEPSDAGSLTIEGGAGGSPFADPCQAGDVLIGVGGKLDDQGRIGELFGVCAALVVIDDGVKFLAAQGPTTDLPTQGMTGVGGSFMSVCESSSAVVGFRGRESMWIDQLVIRCAKITIAEAMGDYSLVLEPTVELAPAGTNVDGMAFAEQDCPAGQVASGQTGRAGQVLDAFGLACSSLTLVL